ncbi:MAG TPA: pitrilysin family protein [Candidatus Margulisiibacteriota bacterium]|nr:pitrilysin family protein [Candidatus Margulisiibacteriota bacterium]
MLRVQRFRNRGLRVLYQHIPGPLTTIALSVRAGARFDGRHPGIAHMAEHMLFQGTASLDQVMLNRRAAELGGEHNADTGYETISLTFEVFNEDVGDALALLAEQFYRSQVSHDRFRKERRVVIDEIRGRMDDPPERLHARAWGRFFRGALSHPVCGSVQSLQAMCAADVGAFIRRYFTHAHCVLAVVGGISIAATRNAVQRHFSAGHAGAKQAEPRVTLGQHGSLRLRGSGGQAYVTKLIAVPSVPRQLIAVGMALDIVGSDPDSRLFQEVRERLGLGYEVSATLDWGAGWAVAIISASAARAAARRLVDAVENTCQRAAAEGFSTDELQRARKKLRYRYASLAESRYDRALALAEGTLLRFPLPEEAERIVSRMPEAEIEAAWRGVLQGRTLTALLAD